MNPEKDCIAHMASNEIYFDGMFKKDGDLHRFSRDQKKDQEDEFYSWSEWSFNGKDYVKVYYGTWSGGLTEYYYKSYGDNSSLSPEDKIRFKIIEDQKQKELQEKLKKQKEERLERAKQLWLKTFDIPLPIHLEYLNHKKVKSYGIRYGKDYDLEDVIVIPIRNTDNEIQAVQHIKSNGDKKIHGLQKGNFHLIGEIKDNSVIFICEGYATGASVYEAIDSPVVVCFTCGALDAVIHNIKNKYPNNPITILADDDCEVNDNPGKTKAEEAAKKYKCNVMLPKFPESFKLQCGKKPTDFNDSHVHFGLDEVKKQFKHLKPHLSILTFRELVNLKIEPKKIILSPWLPEKGLTMIHAERGIGKTFIALSAAHAIVSGGKLFNWEAKEPRRVLYIDGEMPIDTMQERLILIENGSETKIINDSYFKLISSDHQERGIRDITSPEGQLDITTLIHDIDVIFLDNLSTLARSGSENEAESWSSIQEWLLTLRKMGKSVVFIHHAGKGGKQRGTSKREDVLDTVINLRKSKNNDDDKETKFEVYFEKTRNFNGIEAQPFEAHLIKTDKEIKWNFKSLAETNKEIAIKFHLEGMSFSEIANEMKVNKSTISRWLKGYIFPKIS